MPLRKSGYVQFMSALLLLGVVARWKLQSYCQEPMICSIVYDIRIEGDHVNVAATITHLGIDSPIGIAGDMQQLGVSDIAFFGESGTQIFPRVLPVDDRVRTSVAYVFSPGEGAILARFIAEIVAHIPDTYEKTAMGYGWYSNRTRGYRKKHGTLAPDKPVRCAEADSDKAPIEARRAWARLIAKVYEVNPLLCPRCGSEMKVVAVIDKEDAIYKILRHLGLLAAPEESRAPPATGPSAGISPPRSQAPPDMFTSTDFTALPKAPLTELPAWEFPEAPGPDFASRPGPDPGEHFDDRDDGPDTDSDGVA